jgi:hypothetical protein
MGASVTAIKGPKGIDDALSAGVSLQRRDFTPEQLARWHRAAKRPAPEPDPFPTRAPLSPEVRRAMGDLLSVLREHWPTDEDTHREAGVSLAGYLFQEGVPASLSKMVLSNISRTLSPLGNAVATTMERGRSGKRIWARPQFTNAVGRSATEAVRAFIVVLHAHGLLSGGGVLVDYEYERIRETHEREKAIYKELAELARAEGREQDEKALARLSNCGDYVCRAGCPECKRAICQTRIRCEMDACFWCGPRRRDAAVKAMAVTWQEKETSGLTHYVARVELGDPSFAGVKKMQAKLTRSLAKKHRGQVRFIRVPGALLALSPSVDILKDDWRKLPGKATKHKAAHAVTAVAKAWSERHKFVREKLKAAHVADGVTRARILRELYESGWVTRATITTAGKTARASFPWPTKATARAALKKRAADERAKGRKGETEESVPDLCREHGLPVRWQGVNQRTGRIVIQGAHVMPKLSTLIAADDQRCGAPWPAVKKRAPREYERPWWSLIEWKVGAPPVDW